MLHFLRYTFIPTALAILFLRTTLYAPSLVSEVSNIPLTAPNDPYAICTDIGYTSLKNQTGSYFTTLPFSPEELADDHIWKFVGPELWLNNTQYTPTDLVPIKNQYIEQRGRVSKLRKEAAEALWKMAEAFHNEFNTGLIVVSGYRSYDYQQRLVDLGCSSNLCAPPGHSEHQLWLAIDILEASTKEEYDRNPTYTKYYNWMKKNAHLYWFHQSYQRWASGDGYDIEPWHWRYLWTDLATELIRLNWSFTEYSTLQNLVNKDTVSIIQ